METERIQNGADVTKTINPAGNDGWITLKNKYHTKCLNCQEEIDEGTKILWKKGTGVKHVTCEAKLADKMPEEKKITITEKEWQDFEKYSHDILLKKTECQCCGKYLGESDKVTSWWINDDKRTCEKHFSV